jgi:soluble lytic murein transglycosylase-like protein
MANRRGQSVTLLLLLGAGAVAWVVKDHLATPFDHLFDAAGKTWGVDPNLLRAFGRKESKFRAQAISPKNDNGTRDYGIMQINSTNFAKLGVTESNVLDPAVNINAAGKLLAGMKTELGDRYTYHAIVSAYNVGTPTVKARGIVNEPYVAEVTYHHQLYALGRMFA